MRTFWLNVRLFFQGALLSYVALFRWLRPTTYLASKIVMPLAQILFFTFLGMYATGRSNASFYIIGNAVQLAAVSGIYGVTMSIGGDRWEGTLLYLFGTPANRLALFTGRAFFHVLDGILGVFVGLAWGVILLGLDLSHVHRVGVADRHPHHNLQHLRTWPAVGMRQPGERGYDVRQQQLRTSCC